MHADFFTEKGCTPCHPVNDRRMTPYAFPPAVQEQSPDGFRQAYHSQCIGCHRDPSRAGNRKPPVTCANVSGLLPSHPG
nr:cytochrome c3 family protein [Deltaproteobacteria bacterium]